MSQQQKVDSLLLIEKVELKKDNFDTNHNINSEEIINGISLLMLVPNGTINNNDNNTTITKAITFENNNNNNDEVNVDGGGSRLTLPLTSPLSSSVTTSVPIIRTDSVISQLSGESDIPTDGERTNYIQTLMHLLNGFVGSGILSMPMAFRDGGIVLASALNPVIGIMSLYCIHMLLSINRFAMKRTSSDIPFNYHEVYEVVKVKS